MVYFSKSGGWHVPGFFFFTILIMASILAVIHGPRWLLEHQSSNPVFQAGGRSGVGQKEHSSLLTQPKRGSFGSPTQHLMSYWSKYKYVTVVHCKKDWKFRDFSWLLTTPNTTGVLFLRTGENGYCIGGQSLILIFSSLLFWSCKGLG